MPSQQETFQAIIKTVDESSSALRAISRQITNLKASTAKAETQIERLDRPGLWSALRGNAKLVDEHFGHLGESIGKVHEKISALVPALGGLAALASVEGLVDLVDKVAERRTETLDRFARLGNPDPTKMLAMTSAARLAFVDVERLDKGLSKLSFNMFRADQGKDKDVASPFKHLHINLRDAKTHMLRDIGDVVPDLADAIEKNRQSATSPRHGQNALWCQRRRGPAAYAVRGQQGNAKLRERNARRGLPLHSRGRRES